MKLIKDSYIHLLWSLLMLAIPISKAISSIAMISLLILSMFRFIERRSDWKTRLHRFHELWILAIPFFVLLLSLLYSEDLSRGIKILNRSISYLLIPFIAWANGDILAPKVKQYLWMLVLATGFGCVVTLILYVLPEVSVQQIVDLERATGFKMKPYLELTKRTAFGLYSPFIGRLQFSNLIAFSIMIMLSFVLDREKRIRNLILLSLLVITSIMLGGRGGQLGMLAGLGVWLVFLYSNTLHQRMQKIMGKRLAWIVFSLSVMIIGISSAYIAFNYVPAVQQRYGQLIWEMDLFYNGGYEEYDYVHFTSVRRILSYQHSWELIQENPILGVGVGDYQNEMEKIYAADPYEFPVNSHHMFLYMWANAGLLGLLAYVGMLFYWIRYIIWHPDTSQRTRLLGTSLLVVICVILNFDSFLNQTDLMSMLCILCLIFYIKTIDSITKNQRNIKS